MKSDWGQTPGARPRGVALFLFVLSSAIAAIGFAVAFSADDASAFWLLAEPRWSVAAGLLCAVMIVLVQRAMGAALSERAKNLPPYRPPEMGGRGVNRP